MPWVRLDDHFDEHPKIAQLDDRALAFWVCGLAYCNRSLTDGFIPRTVGMTLRYYDGNGEAPWRMLEIVGLWEVATGGWRVHDYAKYQSLKAEILEARSKKQAAGQAGGQASATARAQAKRKQMLKQNSTPTPTPTPTPIPTPIPEETVEQAGVTPDGVRQADFPDGLFDDLPDPTWLTKLKTIPGWFPSKFQDAALLKVFASLGSPEGVGEDVATSMVSSLSYNKAKNRWEQGGKTYANLRATFENWVRIRMKGEHSAQHATNGHRPVAALVATRDVPPGAKVYIDRETYS